MPADTLCMKIVPIKTFLRLELPKFKDRSEVAAILCSTDRFRPELLQDVLTLQVTFEDVTDGAGAFDLSHARRIALFVDELPPRIRRLYVCCDAGQSRSPAVGAAITRHFGCSDHAIWKNPKYRPNPHVYSVLCEEFRIKVSHFALKRLNLMNQLAFSGAIRKARK